MRNRPAFTLIEILVVIVIVSMMAVIAIANYGLVRQSAKMDYAADALVNLVNRQQGNARSGRQEVSSGETGGPLCYGVAFSKEEPYVREVTAPYVSVDMTVNQNLADFCNMEKSTYTQFEQFEDNKISKIDRFGADANDLTIMYRPPEARISFGSENVGYENNPVVTITFQSVNGKESRSFTIDTASGLAEKVSTVPRQPGTGTGVLKPKPIMPSVPVNTPILTLPRTPVSIPAGTQTSTRIPTLKLPSSSSSSSSVSPSSLSGTVINLNNR